MNYRDKLIESIINYLNSHLDRSIEDNLKIYELFKDDDIEFLKRMIPVELQPEIEKN